MPYHPCQNPNCKSYGKSHPNCRCFGPEGNKYADGGAVSSCSGKHRESCEYFDDGGETVPDFDSLPKSEVVPDFDSLPKSQPAKQDVSAQGEVPDFDNLPKSDDSDVPDFDKLPVTAQQPISMGDSILRDFEAEARGVTGGLSTVFETKVLGMNPEGIQQRKDDTSGFISPGQLEAAGLVGSLVSPGGPLKVAMGKLGQVVPATVAASKWLNAAIQGAAWGASGELNNNILGKDPTSTPDTVAHILASSVGSVLTHGLFNTLGAKALSEKTASKVLNWGKKLSESAVINLADKPVSKAALVGSAGTVAATANHYGVLKQLAEVGSSLGWVFRKTIPHLQDIVEKKLAGADEYIGMAVLKALATEKYSAIPTAIKLGEAVANTTRKLLPATDALMKAGVSKLIPPAHDYLKSTLSDQVANGALNEELQKESGPTNQVDPSLIPPHDNPMPMAKGGVVGKGKQAALGHDKTDHLAEVWPEHAAMLGAAKARIHTYLNSVRPIDSPNATFDETHKDREKERSYKHALELAVNPLSVLNHVNQSTLTPELLKHFVSLHPEVHEMLSNKISESLIKEKMAGRKPPYSKRQSMSMFLGHDLDSVLSQPAIAAAQGVFMQKQAGQQMQQQGQKQTPKKGKASLSKSADSSLTQDQARAQRAQKV